MPPKVVVTDHGFSNLDIEAEILNEVDAEIEVLQAESSDEIIAAADDAEALLNQYAELPSKVFDELDDLEVVGRYGIGVDNVDVEAATRNDVLVVNVPSYCVDDVSTHAMSLLLACARKIPSLDTSVKNGVWDWEQAVPMHRLAGKTLGFVAFGKIARRVSEKASGFEFEQITYDPYVSEADLADTPVSKVSFDELLDLADLISIHAPLTDETESLFDHEAFSSMNDDAILVNTARGPIVDERALYEALSNNEIGAAGLDVLNEEPPEDSPLLELDSVIITPHVAWYSEESKTELRQNVARDVRRVLRGERPTAVVNTDLVE